jgi:hypothetical protein
MSVAFYKLLQRRAFVTAMGSVRKHFTKLHLLSATASLRALSDVFPIGNFTGNWAGLILASFLLHRRSVTGLTSVFWLDLDLPVALMTARSALHAALLPLFPLTPLAIDRAVLNLAIHFFLLWSFAWFAAVLSLLIEVSLVLLLPWTTSRRAPAPVAPLRPDAIDGATLNITVKHALQRPRTTQTAELRLDGDLTSLFLPATPAAGIALCFSPVTNFTIDWTRDDKARNELLRLWALTTAMRGLNENWTGHLLLTIIT